jgi:hypothetical protein
LYVSPYGHILVTESRRGPVYSLNCSYLKHYISKSVNYNLNPPILCVIWYHDQCISHGNVSYGTTTSAFHLAMCHTVPRPVKPSNMSYGTTTSVFHLAMCHTVPQPVYFTWQCGMRYHDQCNLAMCHMVPQPVCFTWQCVLQYHNQCISPGNVLYGTTTSAFHLAMWHAVPGPVQPSNISCTVPQPVPFT